MSENGCTWQASLRRGLRNLLLLLAAGCALRVALYSWWLWRFDADLLEQAQTMSVHLRSGGQGDVRPEPRFDPPPPEDHRLQTYWQVNAVAGKVLGAAAALCDFRFPVPSAASAPRFDWYHCYYLHRMRVVTLPVHFGEGASGQELLLQFAQDHRRFRERLEALDSWLVLGTGLMVLAQLLWNRRKMWGRMREKRRGAPVPSVLVRLLAGLFLVVTVVLLLAGYATYMLVEDGWVRQMDQALENRARGVAALCDRIDGRWRLDVTHLDTSIFRDAKSMQYFQVWDERGAVVGRSTSLAHLNLPRPDSGLASVRYDWFHPTYLHRTRIASLEVLREGEHLRVCFGQDYRGMKAKLRELRGILLWVWAGATFLLGALMVLLVHVSLRPLRQIARRLQSLDAGHWGDFSVDAVPSEVRPLVDALSQALARLEEAFRRERSLLANLAHELRTPLAGLRTTLEVGVVDEEVYAREAMRSSVAITVQMQGIIDSLLLLGRLESGKVSSRMGVVDLETLLVEYPEVFTGVACDIDPGLRLRADRDWLLLVLRNLLDNARRHAGEGGWIRLEAHGLKDEVHLAIVNSGCDLDVDEIGRVFERFWRKDPARSVGARNAGLGLPLCRDLVGNMAGRISATLPEPGAFAVEMWLEGANSDDFIFPSSSPNGDATQAQRGANP